jgi:hypothetical protein
MGMWRIYSNLDPHGSHHKGIQKKKKKKKKEQFYDNSSYLQNRIISRASIDKVCTEYDL